MATIRGESSDKKITAIYDSCAEKIRIYSNWRLVILETSDLQPTIEALENLKQNVISTLGSDALK